MEDSGIYVCEGINQAGVSRKEVELVIQGEQSVINDLLLLVIILVVLLVLNKVLFKNKLFTKNYIEGFEELIIFLMHGKHLK